MDEHDLRNATTGIKGMLMPYWKSGKLADEDWVYLLLYLEKIENACNDAARETKQVRHDGC